MTTDLWGYIYINAEVIPSRLTQGQFQDRGWTEYPAQGGFWLPCGEEPTSQEIYALQTAQEYSEIQDYQIVHPMPVE